MSDIDDKILAAIRAEAESSGDDYSVELGPVGLALESFKGAFRWFAGLSFFLILVFVGIGVYCAYNFLYATDLAIKLNWFGGGLLAVIVVTVLRLWFLMELNRLSIRREIKRLELQVALLGAQFDGVRDPE